MPLRPGALVARYRIERFLASGGSADVYAATHGDTGERVALKVLARLRGVDRDRALREVAIARTLDHPGLVRVRDHGLAPDEGLYLTMDLLDGETLASRLTRGALAPEESVAVLAQVCDAVAHAHAKGVVHRDLKPANLFLVARSDGTLDARVLDFGLATAVDAAALTRTGDLLGTPAYMAPERLTGRRDVDPRADVWGLGVTLYECLTGALPFVAESPLGVMFQAAYGAPVPLERRLRDAPEDLVALVRACLANRAEDRPADARALGDALRALRVEGLRARTVDRGDAVVDDARELRLVVAVLVRDPRDPALWQQLVDDARAESFTLPQGALALFGRTRWSERVPDDALAFARTVAPASAAVSMVAARVERDGPLPPSLVEAALAVMPPRGIGVDAGCASLLRDRCVVSLTPRGHRTVPLLDTAPARDVTALPFVGRRDELAWLLASLDEAVRSETPQARALYGPPGVGRSRMLSEALRAVAERVPEVRTLHVRCDGATADTPLSGLRTLLGTHLPARVVDALQTPSRGSDPQGALDRVRAHVGAVLETLVYDGPLVLALDDAQWLDPTSRAVLRSVFDASPRAPIALWLVATRGHEESVARVHARCLRREIPRLSTHDATALVRALGVTDDARLTSVLDRAEGMPATLEALALAPGDDVLPLDVEAAVRAQLDRLATPTRDALKRAAVFGRVFWREGLVALGAVDETAVLERLGWIAPRPHPRLACEGEYEFRRAVAAEAARALLTPEALRDLHARAAVWLEALPDALPEEIAAHWSAADNRTRAAHHAVRAAVQRAACGVAESAVRAAAEALRYDLDARTRWRVLGARDDALQLAGDRALQREGIEAMRALAAELGDDARAELAWRTVHHARMVGDAAMAREAAAALVEGALAGAARWRVAALGELAFLEADHGRTADARALAARAAEIPCDDVWVRARALHALAYVTVEQGDDLADGLARYAEAGDGYRLAGDLRREAITLVNRAATLALLGRFAEALDVLDLALDRAKAVGNLRTVAVCFENRGAVRRALGDHEDADDDLAQSLERAAALGHARLADAAHIERLYLSLARGDDDATLRARREPVLQILAGDGDAAATAPALASVLRADARLGERHEDRVQRARTLVDALAATPLHAAELLAALVAVDARDHDRARYESALAQTLAHTRDGAERAVRRRGLERRWLVEAPSGAP